MCAEHAPPPRQRADLFVVARRFAVLVGGDSEDGYRPTPRHARLSRFNLPPIQHCLFASASFVRVPDRTLEWASE
jgi:hypothetical protein